MKPRVTTKPANKCHYGLLKIFALLTLFAVPMLAALFIYKNPQHAIHSTVNHGTLLQQKISLDELNLQDQAGNRIHHPPWGKKWKLLYVVVHPCSSQCKENLMLIHNVILALGKNRNRVAPLIATVGDKSELVPNTLIVTKKDYAHWSGQASTDKNKLFLIDPLGNAVLSYEDNFVPRDLFKDLRLLLSTSQIG